jgi:GT2 family glycosyltransferase
MRTVLNAGTGFFMNQRDALGFSEEILRMEQLMSSAQKYLPISVIVVNHNAGALLSECVKAVLRSVEQVVVVDNHSADDSMQHLMGLFGSDPRLTTVYSKANKGFAGGCNLGMDAATEPFLLFLNPDCIVGEHAVKHIYQAIYQDPSVGMVGGLLTNIDGSEQGGGRRAVPTPWRSFVRAFGLTRLSSRWPKLFFDFHMHRQPLPDHPIDVEAISGALMLVRRSALEALGAWDEAYFLHCEDLDLCMRFRQRGWRIVFVPHAPVVHYLGHSSKSRPFFVEWHKHKGMVRFYRKFFGHQYPGILMLVVRMGVWVRFGLVSARLVWNRLHSR